MTKLVAFFALGVLIFPVDGASQGRFGRRTTDLATTPEIRILGPVSTAMHAVDGSTVTITGMAYCVADCVTLVDWTCDNCGTTSGTATGTNGAWTLTITDLASGNNTITVRATDGASPATAQIVVNNTGGGGDVTPPTINIDTPTTATTFVSATEPVAMSGTASDDVGVSSVTATLVSGPCNTPVAQDTTAWSITGGVDFTAVGTCVVSVTAQDAAGLQGTDQISIQYTGTLTVSPAEFGGSAEVNKLYQRTATASGGITPYTWSEVGSVLSTDPECAGLSLSQVGSSGVVSGTPTTAGTCGPITLRVTDSDTGPSTDDEDYTITVNPEGTGGNHAYFEGLCDGTEVYCNGLRSIAEIEEGDLFNSGSVNELDYSSVEDAAEVHLKSGQGHNSQGRRYNLFNITSGTAMVTWDVKIDSSFAYLRNPDDFLRTHKAFMVGSPDHGGSGKWQTTKLDYKQAQNTEFCPSGTAVARTFLSVSGPGRITYGPGYVEGDSELIDPNMAEMCFEPNEWARYTLFFEDLDANWANSPALSSGKTAQGGTATSLQLANTETFTDNQIVGKIIEITSGQGVGATNQVLTYTASDFTATMKHQWQVTPNNTSVYTVHDSTWVSFSAWFATESVAPFQIYDGAQIGNDGQGINGWHLQMNTSQSGIDPNPSNFRDRFLWFRNLAVISGLTKAQVIAQLEQP